MNIGGPIDSSVPGTANYRPGSAPPDYRALIAQAMAGQGYNPYDPSFFNGQRLDEVTSDPATEGLTQEGSALTGDMGPGMGMAPATSQSNQDTGFGSTLGAGMLGGFAPGTGLGMSQHGYSSGYGSKADAFNQDADAVTAAIADVIGYNSQVNDAVNALGYAPGTLAPGTPSPSTPGNLAGLGFVSSPASLNTDTSVSTGTDQGGAAIAADVGGLTGLNAGVNDAAAAAVGLGNEGGGGGGGSGDGGK
jgi:hypothetical protein